MTLALRSEICAISTRSFFFMGVSRFRIWNRVRKNETDPNQHHGVFLAISIREWRCACGVGMEQRATFQTPTPLGPRTCTRASFSNPTVLDKKQAIPLAYRRSSFLAHHRCQLSEVSGVETAHCPFRIFEALRGGGNAFLPIYA